MVPLNVTSFYGYVDDDDVVAKTTKMMMITNF